MSDNRRIYQPDQAHAHEKPRSARQSTPLDYGPKHVPIRRERSQRPIEQTPKRERIGK